MGSRHEQTFLQRGHTDGHGHMERKIREMKIKTTMKCHLTPVRMAKINKETTGVGKDVKKEEPSCTVTGNGNWYSHSVKLYGGS